MSNNFYNFFNFSCLRNQIFSGDGEKKNFMLDITTKNYNRCMKYGLKCFNKTPSYLIFTYVYYLKDNNDPGIRRLLSLVLDKVSPNVMMLLFLIRSGVAYEYVKEKIKLMEYKDYLYYLVYIEMMSKGVFECDEKFLENVLDNVDDWRIYEYALSHDIQISKRNTVNYLYYRVHKMKHNTELSNEERSIIISLLGKVKYYSDIEYILNLLEDRKIKFELSNDCSNVQSTKDLEPTNGIDNLNNIVLKYVVDFLRKGFEKDKLHRLFEIYKNHKEIEVIKIIIAHLIATKETNNIFLALYLSSIHMKDSLSNFEIKLIYLFLCRHFCLYKEVKEMMDKLDIKNNDLFSTAFIWADILLLKGLNDQTQVKNYKNTVVKYLKNTIDFAITFLDNSQFIHASSLLDVYDKLDNDAVINEIEGGKLVSTTPKTFCSELLGHHCEYLFSKATANSESIAGKHATITGIEFDVESLPKNEYFNINDASFLIWFKKNLQ